MQILYLTERTTVHDWRFISGVVSAGHEVHLLSLNPDRDTATGVLLPDGLWRLPAEWSASSLRSLMVDRHIDVVHAGPLTTAGFIAADIGLRPLVSVSWAFDLLLEARENAAAHRRVSVALAASDVVIVDSEVVERSVRSEHGYRGRIERFPWGTDLGLFHPVDESVSVPKDTSVVVCTRAWEPLYRVDLVVEAFALACAQEPRLRLTLANDGSQSSMLQQRIEALSIGHLVHIRGHITERELASLLQESDIYVSASSVDGASVSLLQALATGLLTVCTDIPGNREWTGNEPGSRLIDTADPGAWAEAMVEAARLETRKRERVRVAHRATAEHHADWRSNLKGLLRAYEYAASAGATPRG